MLWTVTPLPCLPAALTKDRARNAKLKIKRSTRTTSLELSYAELPSPIGKTLEAKNRMRWRRDPKISDTNEEATYSKPPAMARRMSFARMGAFCSSGEG